MRSFLINFRWQIPLNWQQYILSSKAKNRHFYSYQKLKNRCSTKLFGFDILYNLAKNIL